VLQPDAEEFIHSLPTG